MKSKLLFIFISLSQIMSAQTFTEATNTPFDGVSESAIAFADVDGDSDPDLLIVGVTRDYGFIANIFTNDGLGNFTEVTNTPLDGTQTGSTAFADVDGDNDPDLLITGSKKLGDQISKLYINDGTSSFSKQMGNPFEGVSFSSIAFSDVDEDGDPDLLITGLTNSSETIAKLYINDGIGNFTEMVGTPFEGVRSSSIAFADVNGDGYDDVLITGQNSSREYIANLYTNDGMGEFTEVLSTPFEGVRSSSIAFADVNGDGYDDVLITGQNSSFELIAKLYTNDGMGDFTEMVGTPFEGVWYSSSAFSDVDRDNDPDLLITGRNTSGERIAKLYTNEGMGQFTEQMGTPFVGISNSSIAFSDVNGDKDPDLLITGQNSSIYGVAKLYINDVMVSSTDHLSPGVQLELTPYPNPTSSNKVNLRFESKEIGYAKLSVYDINGHLLRTQKELTGIGKQTLCMDIASLPPGSYLIQLDKGKRKGVARFVVQ